MVHRLLLYVVLTSSIDFDYVDPRPEERQEEDREYKIARDQERKRKEALWQEEVDRAQAEGLDPPEQPEYPEDSPVRPDWGQSPVEVSDQIRGRHVLTD